MVPVEDFESAAETEGDLRTESKKTGGCGDGGWPSPWRYIQKDVYHPLGNGSISHLGKRNIIFKLHFSGDMLVSRRV